MPNSKYKLRYLPLFYIVGSMENIRPVDDQWVYYFDIGLDVIRSKKNTTLTCDHKSGNILS